MGNLLREKSEKRLSHVNAGLFYLIFLFLFIFPRTEPLVAASDWDLTLRLTDPNGNDHGLIAGADGSATDGFDRFYDFSAPLAGPQMQTDTVQASLTTQVYFYHADYPADVQLLLQDVRSGDFTSAKNWQMDVRSGQTGGYLWNWTVAQGNHCQRYVFTLNDLTDNRQIDLSTSSSYYFFQNTSVRSFILTVNSGGGSTPDLPPTNLWSPRQGSESALLSWMSGGSGTRYRLYRSEASGSGYASVTPLPIQDLTYVDRGLSGGRTYYYVVKSVNGDGCESSPSKEAVVTIP